LTGEVAFELDDADPDAFVAVTTTRIRRPRSACTGTYVVPVAPAMSEHEDGEVDVHRRH
jgi:hypothetical protein